ncbi:MAG: HepT-like ribonuclease domain-containing protein [Planctomycetota bacterium]
MLFSAELVRERVEGRRYEELEGDLEFQDLIVHRIEIIGEAARRVSTETLSRIPDVDWTGAKGMRDRLIHGYHDIDLEVVWDVATVRVPTLIDAVNPFLAQYPPPSS